MMSMTSREFAMKLQSELPMQSIPSKLANESWEDYKGRVLRVKKRNRVLFDEALSKVPEEVILNLKEEPERTQETKEYVQWLRKNNKIDPNLLPPR